MKKILFILSIIMFCKVSSAKPESKLLAPDNAVAEIEVFAKKNLNEKTDLEEVKKVLNTLLLLDNDDPSRTAVLILSKSYSQHKSIYDRAIKSIETKKNKKQLSEIKQILAQYYKNGNG